MKLALFCASLLCMGVANAQNAPLFETLDYQKHTTQSLNTNNKQDQHNHAAIKVRVNKSVLSAQRQRFVRAAENAQHQQAVTELQIALPDGTVRSVVITRVKDNTNDGYSVFGHIQGQPSHKVAINVINNEAYAGTVLLDDISYKIIPESDGISIIEPILGEEHQCAGGQIDHRLERQIQSQITPQFEQQLTPELLNSSALSQVDVMLLYTGAARNGAGGTSYMQALAQQSIDQMNLALENSNVNAWVNLVYANEIAYRETGSGYTDLDWVTANSTVAQLRNTYAADLVGMIIENPGNLCGLGWYMATPSTNFASRGFQITRRSCVGGWTISHEFGHNMGLQHDEANAGGSPGPYQYNYGHLLANNTHTIMAYGSSCNWCPAINHFSNPDVYYNGYATGSAYHNNARRLNDTRAYVANFRQGNDSTPPRETIELTKGKAETLTSLNASAEQKYRIEVPANASNLVINTSGGNGNVDLFVRFGAEASSQQYDCASEGANNAESCTISVPQQGSYFITVAAKANSTNVNVVADYSVATPDFKYLGRAYINHGGYAILPQNNYGYYYAKAGAHKAELSVSSTRRTDFDLYLQRWNGYQWVYVANSKSPTNSETINYNGTAGYYRWYVYSYSGAGTATLRYNIPE
ncbi:pre-peptidase C-terminal domain-containing protein [Rheinheimera sp. WS51]|uniref:PPC domain-containing protein n=1 Tax=Rheinheimera sp. WS51 TaxID=3425886 RepID=UPI003D93EA46